MSALHRPTNPNLALLEMAVQQLDDLADRVVFLGGCATGLLLTDMAAPPIRFTLDVDVITEVATLAEYYRLAEQLHDRGFKRKTPAKMLRFAAGKRAVSFQILCDGIPDVFQSLLLGIPY